MKRAVYIQREVNEISTIEGLTSIFEAIASLHISQIKSKVTSSTNFFHELWKIYTQLRREGGKSAVPVRAAGRPALVAVTSDGGLIGDIDDRIIEAMLQQLGREQADIYVIGAHGATLLGRRGIRPVRVYPLPDTDTDFDFTELVEILQQRGQATVYYQTYISLLRQEPARIDLFSAVEELSKGAAESDQIISSRDYIFEPSLDEVIAYMESVMMEVALSQVVLESKLAQYASRFNAMSRAKTKAKDMRHQLRLEYSRAKRSASDERIKEIVSAMKVMRQA